MKSVSGRQQIQHAADTIGGQTGDNQPREPADAYIDRAGRAGRRSIEKARRPARAGASTYLYARHQILENISDDVRHAGMYFPARRIHLPNLRE